MKILYCLGKEVLGQAEREAPSFLTQLLPPTHQPPHAETYPAHNRAKALQKRRVGWWSPPHGSFQKPNPSIGKRANSK